jgi:phosphoribosylamine--glycine ligase
MKILIMSKSGDGFGLAQKLKEEGNEVRIWVQEKGFEFVSQGLIEQVPSWRPSASSWAELVVADMVGFGRFALPLDSFDVKHLGFNQIADTMELDRAKQMQLFRKFNIQIPHTEEFENPSAALDILDDWPNSGVVIKPSGNLHTGKTFVIDEPLIYEWALEQFSGDQDLIVQSLVKGVEISTEGWFDGSKWIEPFNHTMEEKRLFPGSGPNTGCMGNVVWAIKEPEKDAFVKNLKRLTPFLKAAGYKGPLDLNTIANGEGIFVLEATARFGYDAIEAFYELLKTKDFGGDLEELVDGNLPRFSIDPDLFGIAIRLTLPPYPHRKADSRDKGMPVIFPDDLSNVFLTDVFFNNNVFRWSASDGVVCKVTGKGKTVEDARKDAYSTVDLIKAEGLQFRDDIGLRVR